MGHDVRVHRPGEAAVCSQCGATVKDRWLEIPHQEKDSFEIKTWCRGCLLENVGCPEEAARCRKEDAACATCGGQGAVVSEYREAGGGETWEDCPDCGACPACDGAGKTDTCANCDQPSALVQIGGCDHTCWTCGGTGEK